MHERKDLNDLVLILQKERKEIWKRTAELLAKPRRKRVEVNISKIQEYGIENSTVLVPGKVLGTGKFSKKFTVAAFAFSETARKAINESGGKILSIKDLLSQNPEGKSVVIII